MLKSGEFDDKKILLIDKEPKTKNDRTWCFWEKENGFFEKIVFRKWDELSFFSDDLSISMNITPYQYKMIRGIDFYNYCFDEIKKNINIEVFYGDSGGAFFHKEGITLILNGEQVNIDHAVVFNSIYNAKQNQTGIKTLLQHFKGWVVETDIPSFNPGKATMMDFRVHQDHGTAFIYVLPFSETKALVEYTLFTKSLLTSEQYNDEIKNYIRTILKIDRYSLVEEEFGVIPMTNQKFQFHRAGIYHIGTAGGQTKPSSGYTFQFIQKQSKQIVDQLLAGKSLTLIPDTPKRFRFYDNTLLHILYHNKLQGKRVFTRLFKKNKPQRVLRFMDNESSLSDELKIISSLPTWPFLKAALKQI
jgi:lycopene beta-cyclase